MKTPARPRVCTSNLRCWLSEWTLKLNQAQAQGFARLIKVAQDLGTAIFTSTEYTALNTSNHDYVTHLYAAFLQRTADSLKP